MTRRENSTRHAPRSHRGLPARPRACSTARLEWGPGHPSFLRRCHLADLILGTARLYSSPCPVSAYPETAGPRWAGAGAPGRRSRCPPALALDPGSELRDAGTEPLPSLERQTPMFQRVQGNLPSPLIPEQGPSMGQAGASVLPAQRVEPEAGPHLQGHLQANYHQPRAAPPTTSTTEAPPAPREPQ